MHLAIIPFFGLVAAQHTSFNRTTINETTKVDTASTSRTAFNHSVSVPFSSDKSSTTDIASVETVFATLTYITTSTIDTRRKATSDNNHASRAFSNASQALLTTCPVTSYARELPTLLLSLESDRCAYMSAYSTDQWFYNYADPCIQQFCSSSWWSAIFAFTGTYPIIHTTYPWMNIRWVNGSTEFGPLTTVTSSCKSAKS